MIRIAHECPISIFKEVKQKTDYDYALVHLFEQSSDYFNLFIQSLSEGREVILDNSIFELGESFDMDLFALWIKKLNPTIYIVPDVLEDCEGTINKLKSWIDKYKDLQGLKMGVVQGKSYDDIVRCYREIDRDCDCIAISFDYSLYSTLSRTRDKYYDWMKGRQLLIDRLFEDKIINTDKHHHLLGASLPQEFHYYSERKYFFIKSLDTSNPVVHGLKNIRYKDYGLNKKESIKLVEFIYDSVDESQYDDIMFNINKFKKLTNG